MAKKYFYFYIRGLVGCVGKFLMENLALCKNKKNRYLNYLKIYKNIKKDFNKIELPKKTFRAYNMIRNSDFSNGKISEQLIDCIKGRSFNLGAIKCFNVFDKYINDLYPLTSEFKKYLNSQIDNNIHLA